MTGNRRCIGLDVHREFAQVAIWQGGAVAQAGTFATTAEGVREFAASLGPADEVALEATGNTWAIAAVLASRADRVVVSNPAKTRAIAEAKVKTDKGRRGDLGAAAGGCFPAAGVDA
jgi:transposase